MSYKIEELLRSMREYDNTKQAHDEAMAKCDCTWGYRGHSYIVALDKAEKEFATALEQVIDERIEIAFNKCNSPAQ